MVSQSTKNSRRPRVEEQEPGRVGWLHRVVEHVGVEGVAEAVGGEDVEPAVADVGGDAVHRVEDLLHGRPHPLLRRAPTGRPVRRRGADEVEQVGSFGFVELQRPHDAFEDVFGDAVGVAALEAGVVLDADPGQHGDLFAAQPLDPPVAAVDGEPGVGSGEILARRDVRNSRMSCAVSMPSTLRPRPPVEGVPASTPHDRDSLTPRDGWLGGTTQRGGPRDEESSDACSHLQRARFDHRRDPTRPDHQGADRRGGAGRAGLRVRVGPLVLPRRVRPRRRLDRPRVHRRRRRRRRRRHRRHRG